MRKIVLTFGLIAGGIMSAVMIVAFGLADHIGFDHGAVVSYTSMVIAFLMVYFGVRSYRDNIAGGSVKFGRAFVVGLMITMVATVCYVTTWEVMYFKFMPDFGDKYAAYAIEKAKRSGASDSAITVIEKDMAHFKEAYQNPLVNIAYTFLEPLPVGLLFTLVTAGVLSRKKRVGEIVVA